MLFVLLALVNGLLTVLSRMVNASLGRAVGSLGGSFVNHLVGAIAAGAFLLVIQDLGTLPAQLAEVPWVYLLGGCFGVLIVAVSNYAVRHIGTVLFAVLLLVGQLVTSAAIDHFALFGNTHIPMTAPRAGGLLLILLGAIIAIRDRRRQHSATRA